MGPNFFYYWRHTSAGGDNNEKVDWFYRSNCGIHNTGETNFVGGKWESCIGPNVRFQSLNTFWGRPSGIDHFAWVVRHESRHRKDLKEWWPNGRIPEEDQDEDDFPDKLECDISLKDKPGVDIICSEQFDKTYPFKYWLDVKEKQPSYPDEYGYGSGWDDNEHWTLMNQDDWENGSAKGEDWACPGQQSDRLSINLCNQ